MATHKVRDHFYVHLDGKAHGPGTELDLTAEQAERHAAQVESIPEPPKTKAKAKADAACSL